MQSEWHAMSLLDELFADGPMSWEDRLKWIVATMREMSSQTDPQEMNRAYGERMRRLLPVDGRLSLSRRDLSSGWFRITRSSSWKEEVNPWKEKDRLPLLEGGLLSRLIYGDEPQIIENLEISPEDPAAEYLAAYRSFLAIPMYDKGVALNMILLMKKEPHGFRQEQLPSLVWISNLFGRATHNLVLSEQLKKAYEEVDHEMKVVGNIQRALLPSQMPDIPGLSIAAHYQTSQRAGGDYYDFFPLPDGKWGILIADVSGHGTPAAVLMAVTHSLAHTFPGPVSPPEAMLSYVNGHLATLYSARTETFVTAFYAIYDPEARSLTYSSAGHNPPRLKRCMDGSLALLDKARSLPLGIMCHVKYEQETIQLVQGDQLILYTDGITEAHRSAGDMFGVERLDKILENCSVAASDLLQSVLEAVQKFTQGEPPTDDRTVLVLKVR